MAESDLWLSEPFTRGQAWVDLILLANFKDGFIRVAGQRITVKRGQCGWSQVRLAQRWKWSRGKTERFINELQEDGNIIVETSNRNSTITICKYEEYQTGETADETPDNTSDEQQTGSRQGTNKEGNKDKKVKNLIDIPAWLPADDWRDFCRMRGAKFTARAKQLIIIKLDTLRQQGHQPAAVLQQSIERGWTGVFEIKGGYNGNRQNHYQQGAGRPGGSAGEPNGNGYGGRKSQTDIAREITEKIKLDRAARWKANGGRNPDQELLDQPRPVIGLAHSDLHDAEEIR
ncbi:hypothetical protein [Hymenobacter fodinae]|uniref:Uncharacterized protein n=1 Tax=Hymenobacter fodinae TaxID=2510796 RepID=A0A4Z0P1N8_9BACT|nr:hypothetical protein [Hymenobacter fodinae]TGE04647.1 hypothetical protein EU556_20900 [Hymenobacter fodinae]